MLEVRPISDALQATAKNVLNEVPDRVQDDVNHLRNWLRQQAHIRSRTDDQFILNFLRGTKFSLQKAKEKLDCFSTMRSHMPNYFTKRDPLLPEMQALFKEGLFMPLSKVSEKNGARIMLMRIEKLNTKKTPFEALIKAFFMSCDVLFLEDDNCIICGQHIFVDCKGVPLDYILSLNLNELRKVVKIVEEAYPTRLQAIDIVNAPAFCEAVINFVRSMLSSKIKDRIHVYSTRNFDEIYKIIPRSHLPKEYGGESGSVAEATDCWKKKVESYREWFLDEEKYGVDETKRPGKPKSAEELFGIQGSFRKLDID